MPAAAELDWSDTQPIDGVLKCVAAVNQASAKSRSPSRCVRRRLRRCLALEPKPGAPVNRVLPPDRHQCFDEAAVHERRRLGGAGRSSSMDAAGVMRRVAWIVTRRCDEFRRHRRRRHGRDDCHVRQRATLEAWASYDGQHTAADREGA
jgi:hypothetical protein